MSALVDAWLNIENLDAVHAFLNEHDQELSSDDARRHFNHLYKQGRYDDHFGRLAFLSTRTAAVGAQRAMAEHVLVLRARTALAKHASQPTADTYRNISALIDDLVSLCDADPEAHWLQDVLRALETEQDASRRPLPNDGLGRHLLEQFIPPTTEAVLRRNASAPHAAELAIKLLDNSAPTELLDALHHLHPELAAKVAHELVLGNRLDLAARLLERVNAAEWELRHRELFLSSRPIASSRYAELLGRLRRARCSDQYRPLELKNSPLAMDQGVELLELSAALIDARSDAIVDFIPARPSTRTRNSATVVHLIHGSPIAALIEKPDGSVSASVLDLHDQHSVFEHWARLGQMLTGSTSPAAVLDLIDGLASSMYRLLEPLIAAHLTGSATISIVAHGRLRLIPWHAARQGGDSLVAVAPVVNAFSAWAPDETDSTDGEAWAQRGGPFDNALAAGALEAAGVASARSYTTCSVNAYVRHLDRLSSTPSASVHIVDHGVVGPDAAHTFLGHHGGGRIMAASSLAGLAPRERSEIFLSACSLGFAVGEDPASGRGLPWAALQAGFRSVVVPSWPVSTTAAVTLSWKYHQLRSEGAPAPVAAARASLWAMAVSSSEAAEFVMDTAKSSGWTWDGKIDADPLERIVSNLRSQPKPLARSADALAFAVWAS